MLESFEEESFKKSSICEGKVHVRFICVCKRRVAFYFVSHILCKRQHGTRQFHSFKLVPNVTNTSDTVLLHVQSETGTL